MTGGWGRPTGKDVSSGLVTGLFSIPEGMAYANIGGFNPVVGLYSGVVSTIVGSAFARTVLMVTTLTSAIALSSASVLAGAGLDPHDPGAIATLTLLVGLVMLALGLLRLGSVMQFVSKAVMTGFTTGIAPDLPGRENILTADDEIFSSTRDAIDRGQAWVDDHRDARTADEGAPR